VRVRPCCGKRRQQSLPVKRAPSSIEDTSVPCDPGFGRFSLGPNRSHVGARHGLKRRSTAMSASSCPESRTEGIDRDCLPHAPRTPRVLARGETCALRFHARKNVPAIVIITFIAVRHRWYHHIGQCIPTESVLLKGPLDFRMITPSPRFDARKVRFASEGTMTVRQPL
jgi:hypothetical protein